jgi:hypothetical protein
MTRFQQLLINATVIMTTVLVLLCLPKGVAWSATKRLGRFLYEAVVSGPGLRRIDGAD